MLLRALVYGEVQKVKRQARNWEKIFIVLISKQDEHWEYKVSLGAGVVVQQGRHQL